MNHPNDFHCTQSLPKAELLDRCCQEELCELTYYIETLQYIITWENICCTDPYVQEWINICRHEDYCDFLDIMTEIKMECMESSLLELWGYDYDFTNITRQEILDMVNSEIVNGTFGPIINLDTYMSPIRGDNGKIIGATSVTMTWVWDMFSKCERVYFFSSQT